MKQLLVLLFALCIVLPVAATDADGFASRTLFEKTVYIVLPEGKIEAQKYWSLPLGTAEDLVVKREYPGEGTLDITCNANLALISSGYIDGSGYGDRGKITVQAHFAIMKEGALTKIDVDSIDYVYYGGTKVKMKGADAEQELYIMVESERNKVQARGVKAMIYKKTPPHNDLTHMNDHNVVIGFSFTKEGAKRAYKAALSAE